MNSASASPATAPAGSAALRFSARHVRLALVAVGLVFLALSHAASWLRPDHRDVFSLWAMAGLALAALPVLFDSLASLKADGFEATKYYMDQFVALAVLACFATGQYATGTIVAAILIVGQMLEEHTTVGVEEAVNSLLRLSQVKARRLPSATAEQLSVPAAAAHGPTEGELVDAGELRAGDRVALFPGDTVPADGAIVAGRTTLDQASITGESLPVEAGPGSDVYAGTTNLTGAVTLLVRRTGRDTVIGRVTDIVEEAKSSRAPVMRLIDRYTRYYLPLVLILAGLVLFFTGDAPRAISVIIVATPCAFVLASPSAMVAALAVASRLGVLVKGSAHFETARGIDTVVFDKTGTLTTGQLRVVALRPAPGISEDELLRVAASLEARSTHPVARAVVAAAFARGTEFVPVEMLHESAGRGVRGGDLLVGRRGWLTEHGVDVGEELTPDSSTSALFVARKGRLVGTILLADSLRPEAAAAIAALRRLGITEFVMLTGDNAAAAATIARAAGIARYEATCLPERKLAVVRELKAEGRRVLVVGDGVNDAPALAAGDLGVAMGALGSDVAVKTADVALMGSDLRHLPRFLELSDRTLRLINQNLLWGCGFIGLFVLLSALGVVSPIVAAVLHELSAFFVIFNSARLLRFETSADAAS